MTLLLVDEVYTAETLQCPPPVGISGMGEVVLSPGAVVMVVVDGVVFKVDAIPHVVEIGEVSTDNA